MRSAVPAPYDKLRPITVQGVLRVGGRLQNSGLSVDQRHPAVLPARHHVTGLIVRFHHVQQGHCGTQSVLSATRQKFWIVKINSSVRHYLKECRQCRCYKQQACKQLITPLPKCRVTSGKLAFTCTGVDYFRPILVKMKRRDTDAFSRAWLPALSTWKSLPYKRILFFKPFFVLFIDEEASRKYLAIMALTS